MTRLVLPEWLRHNRKVRLAALVFCALACADLLVFFFFFRPEVSRLREHQDRYAELRKRHAEAVLFHRQREALAGINAAIPTQKDMPLVVKELAQDARKLHLAVGSISYDIPRRGQEGLTLLSFTFPASGSYPEVKRFIYDVETSGRMLAVETIDFSTDRQTVKVEIKLLTYIRDAGEK